MKKKKELDKFTKWLLHIGLCFCCTFIPVIVIFHLTDTSSLFATFLLSLMLVSGGVAIYAILGSKLKEVIGRI